jgi:Na+/melibiose symporter-like transporter
VSPSRRAGAVTAGSWVVMVAAAVLIGMLDKWDPWGWLLVVTAVGNIGALYFTVEIRRLERRTRRLDEETEANLLRYEAAKAARRGQSPA